MMRRILFIFSNCFPPRWSVLPCLAFLVCLFSACVGNADVDKQSLEKISFSGNSFSVYILSRGKGVPAEARSSFDQIYQELLELQRQGKLNYLKKEVIGLEGERRICAEFTDSETARLLFLRIKKLAREIDLFDVTSESCAK